MKIPKDFTGDEYWFLDTLKWGCFLNVLGQIAYKVTGRVIDSKDDYENIYRIANNPDDRTACNHENGVLLPKEDGCFILYKNTLVKNVMEEEGSSYRVSYMKIALGSEVKSLLGESEGDLPAWSHLIVELRSSYGYSHFIECDPLDHSKILYDSDPAITENCKRTNGLRVFSYRLINCRRIDKEEKEEVEQKMNKKLSVLSGARLTPSDVIAVIDVLFEKFVSEKVKGITELVLKVAVVALRVVLGVKKKDIEASDVGDQVRDALADGKIDAKEAYSLAMTAMKYAVNASHNKLDDLAYEIIDAIFSEIIERD